MLHVRLTDLHAYIHIDYLDLKYWPILDFQDGGIRHLRFSKVENFNFRSCSEVQYASSHKISRKSVKPFQRYGRFSIFKMAAVRHLGFSKARIFNCPYPSEALRAKMRHRAKFREDRSNCSGDLADFRFFKMATVRHLGFVLRVLGPPTKSIWWSL